MATNTTTQKKPSWLDRLKSTGAYAARAVYNPISTIGVLPKGPVPSQTRGGFGTNRLASRPWATAPSGRPISPPATWQEKLFPGAYRVNAGGMGQFTQSGGPMNPEGTSQSTAEVIYPDRTGAPRLPMSGTRSIPTTAETNFIPAPNGGGGGGNNPPSSTPRDLATEVALNRLLVERETTTGPELPAPIEVPGYDPATYQPLTIQEIDDLIDKARNKAGFLSEAEIQRLEDERKTAIFDIINRQSDLERSRRLEEGNRIVRGTAALYGNLAGGPSNIASPQIEAVQREQETIDRAIEVLDQQRIDALTKEDITSAQRVEDRINELFRRKNELEKNRLDQIVESEESRQFGATFDENSRQFGANYGIDVAKLGLEQQKNVTEILKMQKEDALDSAKFLVDNFGSMATEGLDLSEIAALEQAAQLPFGSLMRSLQTIDEQKLNQLEFVSGTKYQQPGSFNPNTGQFTVIGSAARYIDESGDGASGFGNFADLPTEMQNALLEEYLAAPDKNAFIAQASTNLGKNIAGTLMIGAGQASLRNQPDDATRFAQTSQKIQQAFEDDPENMDVSTAEQYFASRGVDPNSEQAQSFLKVYEPPPFWQFWK